MWLCHIILLQYRYRQQILMYYFASANDWHSNHKISMGLKCDAATAKAIFKKRSADKWRKGPIELPWKMTYFMHETGPSVNYLSRA